MPRQNGKLVLSNIDSNLNCNIYGKQFVTYPLFQLYADDDRVGGIAWIGLTLYNGSTQVGETICVDSPEASGKEEPGEAVYYNLDEVKIDAGLQTSAIVTKITMTLYAHYNDTSYKLKQNGITIQTRSKHQDDLIEIPAEQLVSGYTHYGYVDGVD